MKLKLSKELIIGSTTIIALLALFFGIEFLKGINIFKSANYYYVSYTNVAGLAQSAPVTLNGYKIGLVREISYEYDNPGHVLVELSLDKKLRLPEGTKAAIVTDLLGTASVELHPGLSKSFLEIGSTLEGEMSSGLMGTISDDIMPTVTTIIPHIDSLLLAVNTLVSDPALLASVRRLDNIMINLESSSLQLTRALGGVPTLVNTANGTMVNIKEMSENLSQISSDLAAVSAELKGLPIDSMTTNLNNLISNLERASAQLNSTNSSLGLLLNDPGLYDNLNNTAAHLDSILIDLKRQPKRYIPSIKIF